MDQKSPLPLDFWLRAKKASFIAAQRGVISLPTETLVSEAEEIRREAAKIGSRRVIGQMKHICAEFGIHLDYERNPT